MIWNDKPYGDRILIMPSLLAADFGRLAEGARAAEAAGADALHLDIMDGHFVPNLSMGPEVVRMARRTVGIPLSVHLMMTNPGEYLETFVGAGADILLIHIEIEGDVPGLLRRIRELGARPGITLNPATPPERVFGCLSGVDEVLCMTVNPGHGGQSFMAEVLPKVAILRQRLRRDRNPAAISVDGGIDLTTAPQAAAAGANVFVAGTALYRAPDMADGVARLRNAAGQSFATHPK